jgi:hypothetical protein
MRGPEELRSVQFVTAKGRRFAVIDADNWEALVGWLETVEDTETVRQAHADLAAADRDRKRAGWIEWEVADEIG